jgi:hypothetical protein
VGRGEEAAALAARVPGAAAALDRLRAVPLQAPSPAPKTR